MKQKKRFLIIDANALIHRAYHALPPLRNRKGELINAIYGFCSIFFKILKELEPDFIVAVFDLPFPTFRHKRFKEYKAKRPKTPEELSQQILNVKNLLKEFDIPVLEKKGFEADDIIGTVSQLVFKEKTKPQIENIILTGDSDLFQLVDSDTKVYFLKKGIKNTAFYNEELVKERYQGLDPEELVDFKALKGDPSDNIPGVPGIGEKTALELIKRFGSLENLYSTLNQKPAPLANSIDLNQRTRDLLQEHKEKAFFSRSLVQIERNVPLDFNLEKCQWKNGDREKVIQAIKKLGFRSLIKRLPDFKKSEQNDNVVEEKVDCQRKLF